MTSSCRPTASASHPNGGRAAPRHPAPPYPGPQGLCENGRSAPEALASGDQGVQRRRAASASHRRSVTLRAAIRAQCRGAETTAGSHSIQPPAHSFVAQPRRTRCGGRRGARRIIPARHPLARPSSPRASCNRSSFLRGIIDSSINSNNRKT